MHLQVGKMPTAFLIMMNALHVFGAFIPADEVIGGTRADFVSVHRKVGERTIAARLGGIIALETATGETMRGTPSTANEPSFIFREVTDGKQLLQIIYDGSYTPKNCFVSADQQSILELRGRVEHQALLNPTTAASDASPARGLGTTKNPNVVTSFKSLLPCLNFTHNASDHTLMFVQGSASNGASFTELPPLLRSLVDLGLIKTHCQLDSPKQGKDERQRRSLLTYPKTLWCGQGTQATHYDQLGEEETTDRCCRDHDRCPYPQIDPMERKLFLRNVAPYTISDCRCDKAFHKCLKKARSPVARGVGEVYFNRLKTKCFVIRKKQQCMETSWIGSCLRREKSDTAVVRDARPFPEGKNLTTAEKAQRRKTRRELIDLS